MEFEVSRSEDGPLSNTFRSVVDGGGKESERKSERAYGDPVGTDHNPDPV